jgi:hypothetical protein
MKEMKKSEDIYNSVKGEIDKKKKKTWPFTTILDITEVTK